MPLLEIPAMADPTAAWMDYGLCAGIDAELFFPARGQSTNEAKGVCARCPVREPCLDYALTHGIKHGVWGGLSERERRRVRRARREAPAPPQHRLSVV